MGIAFSLLFAYLQRLFFLLFLIIIDSFPVGQKPLCKAIFGTEKSERQHFFYKILMQLRGTYILLGTIKTNQLSSLVLELRI